MADGKQKIALFGGSFNPPHMGHVISALWLTTHAGFDRVIVIPCREHAFDKELAPFAKRLTMCEYAFRDLASVLVSDMAHDLPPGPTYTIDLVLHCTINVFDIFAGAGQIHTIVGSDCLGEIDKWKDIDEIKRLAPIFELPRDRKTIIPPFSSTLIRTSLEMISMAESEDFHADEKAIEILKKHLKMEIPDLVLKYIEEQKLYRGAICDV